MATSINTPPDDQKKRFSDLALKDYELKVMYLTAHFQRMWTRFNYFVIVEAALIGAIFGDTGIGTAGVIFGACLSFVWYIMGAEDRYLVEVYRKHVQESLDLIGREFWQGEVYPYRAVGDLSDSRELVKGSITGWRREWISTTTLASLIPLAVSFTWLVILVLRIC